MADVLSKLGSVKLKSASDRKVNESAMLPAQPMDPAAMIAMALKRKVRLALLSCVTQMAPSLASDPSPAICPASVGSCTKPSLIPTTCATPNPL
jgi:hypothetical protein